MEETLGNYWKVVENSLTVSCTLGMCDVWDKSLFGAEVVTCVGGVCFAAYCSC